MLKTNRSELKTMLLNIPTLGLYGLLSWNRVAKDANLVCNGDGNRTANVFVKALLSVVTLGVYGVLWNCKLANRISHYCEARGLKTRCSDSSVLLWSIFFPIVAEAKLLKGMNVICEDYNRAMSGSEAAGELPCFVPAPVEQPAACSQTAWQRQPVAQPMRPVAQPAAYSQNTWQRQPAALPMPSTAQPADRWSYSQPAPLPNSGYAGREMASPANTAVRSYGQPAAAAVRYANPSDRPVPSNYYGVTA